MTSHKADYAQAENSGYRFDTTSARVTTEGPGVAYSPSWDRVYPRCPVCHREQYALAVLAFSRGEFGCGRCGHIIREDARLDADGEP